MMGVTTLALASAPATSFITPVSVPPVKVHALVARAARAIPCVTSCSTPESSAKSAAEPVTLMMTDGGFSDQ
jgi:hypothetical protein